MVDPFVIQDIVNQGSLGGVIIEDFGDYVFGRVREGHILGE